MYKLLGLISLIFLFSCDPSKSLIVRNQTGSDITVTVVTTKNIVSFEYLPTEDSLMPNKQLRANLHEILKLQTPIIVLDSTYYTFEFKKGWTGYIIPSGLGGLPFNSIILDSELGNDTIWFRSGGLELEHYELDAKSLGIRKIVLDLKSK